MIIYAGTKADFLESVELSTIAKTIEDNIYALMKRKTALNEFRSWENSLKDMHMVLTDSEIPNNAGIAIEYNIPQTAKRVDFIISGYDNADQPNVIIIELKQWDKLTAVMDKDGVVETYTGNRLREVVHPSYQAWSYSMLIKDYNENVQNDKVDLAPCAYLHNYYRVDNDPLDNKCYQTYLDEAPVFTKGEVFKLREFIKRKVKKGDEKSILYSIDNGKIRPSKSLQNAIGSMLKGNQEFVMLDEQKIVYENILNLAMQSKADNQKRTIIIEGGPGTGKTVVAINLLAKLTQSDQFVQYVSKNSAPRNVYLQKLKGQMKKSSIDNMFMGSGKFTEAQTNTVDTILVDEAHRLNAKSGMFQNLGENQIKEIINTAKCSVFFIDESQRVTMSDIGSVEEIESWAKYNNSAVFKMELTSQFRCNGSDGYLAWLDNVLDIRETANYSMDDIDYDIRVLDSPTDVYELIKSKNDGHTSARMLAGYCWDWIKNGKNRSDIHDIKIGDFSMSWNLGNSTTYAIDESSINEIGCIHTSQGLEFDYVGVIIGEDLSYHNEKIVTDFTKRAKTDQSLKGIKTLYKKDPEAAEKNADEIIKNTYRTLMTRGMKGCYIYCVDKQLNEYLKSRIK